MPEAQQLRGDLVESVHPFSVFAIEGERTVLAVGDDRETAFRSASKPHQLAVSLAMLGDPEDISPQQIAVGCASHSAEPAHLELVRSMLHRFDARAEDLRCGAHAPAHVPSAEAVIRAGDRYTDLHNNCSGKHSFMLASCLRNGWPKDYRPIEHPLQRAIEQQMSQWMLHRPRTVIDGCGVPTFVQPVSCAARAWQRLAAAMRAPSDDPWQKRLYRAGHAMREHPELTSGTGRLDLSIARAAKEPMAVKIGAMGLFCIAIPGRNTGIAIKMHSGSTEALAVAIEWSLARLSADLWERPADWEHALVRNVVGREVGSWRVRES